MEDYRAIEISEIEKIIQKVKTIKNRMFVLGGDVSKDEPNYKTMMKEFDDAIHAGESVIKIINRGTGQMDATTILAIASFERISSDFEKFFVDHAKKVVIEVMKRRPQ